LYVTNPSGNAVRGDGGGNEAGVEGRGGNVVGVARAGPGLRAIGGSSTQGGGGHGILATAGTGGDGDGFAGQFLGGVRVDGTLAIIGNANIFGTLTKTSGAFRIDHPLDPANKYLYHSFVESPDMMNVYNGNVTTDRDGEATVQLPDYFEALNRDFRYQLTVIGQFAQAIVAREISDNRFTIKTDRPSVKVSWQVTGIRQDAYANAHRIEVEQEKPERERGYYLHPEAFDQPAEKSVRWARDTR
jgi:hypothetical protein